MARHDCMRVCPKLAIHAEPYKLSCFALCAWLRGCHLVEVPEKYCKESNFWDLKQCLYHGEAYYTVSLLQRVHYHLKVTLYYFLEF